MERVTEGGAECQVPGSRGCPRDVFDNARVRRLRAARARRSRTGGPGAPVGSTPHHAPPSRRGGRRVRGGRARTHLRT